MKPASEFEEAVAPHLQTLRTYCQYLSASKWEAEDLVQETLLRAFQLFRKKGAFKHPRALIYKIARNLKIDESRRKRGVTVPIDEALHQPYHDKNYASIRGLLEWMADHLSEREVEMLMLSEVFRYSYQDIADELDCTVPAVKMVLHRSKLALRKDGARPDKPRAVKPRSRSGPRMRLFTVERWTSALMAGEL